MAGQHENAGADDGADPEGYEAGRRQGALEWNAAMGGQGLNIPFFRLRAQRSDFRAQKFVMATVQARPGGRAAPAPATGSRCVGVCSVSTSLSPVFRWSRQASADPLAG